MSAAFRTADCVLKRLPFKLPVCCRWSACLISALGTASREWYAVPCLGSDVGAVDFFCGGARTYQNLSSGLRSLLFALVDLWHHAVASGNIVEGGSFLRMLHQLRTGIASGKY